MELLMKICCSCCLNLLLDSDDIVNIIKIIFLNKTVNFKHASKWFAILNNHLQTSELNNKFVLNEIKKLRIVPLVNRNELTSLDEINTVYFPYKFNNSEVTNENIEYLTNLIETELNIIDINRFLCLDNENLNSCLINFLNILGIKTLNAVEIIQNHIIPTFEAAKSVDLNIDFKTRFIIYFLYLHKYSLINADVITRNYDRLKSCILVLVNDSAKNVSKFVSVGNERVYLSSLYNSVDTKEFDDELLKSLSFYFIDLIYLNETIKLNKINKKSSISIEVLIQNWRKFMNLFEVYDVFMPRKCVTSVDFGRFKDLGLKSDGDYEMIDYICEPFYYFVDKIEDFGRFESTDSE
jgi:hypothetical protein